MISVGVINRAIEECRQSKFRIRMGAVIFKGKRILSSGHNGIRSSGINDKYKNYFYSLHAEQAALIGLNWARLSGYSILILRISRTEELLGNAKPCPMCLKLINTIGLKDIYYSDENGQIIQEGKTRTPVNSKPAFP